MVIVEDRSGYEKINLSELIYKLCIIFAIFLYYYDVMTMYMHWNYMQIQDWVRFMVSENKIDFDRVTHYSTQFNIYDRAISQPTTFELSTLKAPCENYSSDLNHQSLFFRKDFDLSIPGPKKTTQSSSGSEALIHVKC